MMNPSRIAKWAVYTVPMVLGEDAELSMQEEDCLVV